MEPRRTILFIIFLGTFLIFQKNTISASTSGSETDRLSLLELKSKLSPIEILATWNASGPHCNWTGVICGPTHHRVTALNISMLNLFGPISPHIGNLSFLRTINFTGNRLTGEIPKEIGKLSRLIYLNLFNNKLGGVIPMNLSYCTELNFLDLTTNNLIGEIPTELGSLKKLFNLYLGKNALTGEFPVSFGNLSSLEIISVAVNNLQGSIPNELSKLKHLKRFQIGVNNLSGVFPPSLFNISSLEIISTADNPIRGSLPTDFGLTLPNLRLFGIGGMLFTGTIPKSIVNASKLTLFEISSNAFVGQIPCNLGSIPGLERLNFGDNQLGGDPTRDLSFLESLSNCTNLTLFSLNLNNLMGKLPDPIANLTIQLKLLSMGTNKISGTIPEAMGNLVNLYFLGMEQNLFSGVIPSSLGRLNKVEKLRLGNNILSGEIPSSLGNMSELNSLSLSNNKLTGNIPESISDCKRLQYIDLSNNYLSGIITPNFIGTEAFYWRLDLSNNRLSGPLPREIGKLASLQYFFLSHNNLSGEIPTDIDNCLSLEQLSLRGNSFQGTIPYTVDNLKGIQYLDFSQNNFSGRIPKVIENLGYLQYLNLSFNDLEGEIPTKGVFKNVSALSLDGNSKLCGGVPELKQPPCPKENKNQKIKLIIALVCVFLFVIALASFGVLYWRSRKIKVSLAALEKDKLMRISYLELYRATNGFSSENTIGSGSCGTVYKGKLNLQMDKLVAVKVLNLQNNRASKSFVAECRVLRNIRHRNLVKIITYCSSIDSNRDEFKALVYEYMPNGNLDKWLHPGEANTSMKLNLLQRISIAIDVASAVDYLHNNCDPPVIHCDLKPSNILIDSEICAHVGDFGLARFLPNATNSLEIISSIGVKGSIGYAPPEYGTGADITTHGDVYAFGILLLEMITGKRPTDDIFKNGLNLHKYAKEALPDQVIEIVDPILIKEQQEATNEDNVGEDDGEIGEIEEQGLIIGSTSYGEFEKNIIAILTIAIACSEEFPTNRMNINDVTRELHRVEDAILGNGRNRP